MGKSSTSSQFDQPRHPHPVEHRVDREPLSSNAWVEQHNDERWGKPEELVGTAVYRIPISNSFLIPNLVFIKVVVFSFKNLLVCT